MPSMTVTIDKSDAHCILKNRNAIEGTVFETLIDGCEEVVASEVESFEQTHVLTWYLEDQSRLIDATSNADDWSGIFSHIGNKMVNAAD